MLYKLCYHLLYIQHEPPRIRSRDERGIRPLRREVSDPDLWDFLYVFAAGPESSNYDEAVKSEDASDDFPLVTDSPEDDQEGRDVSPENKRGGHVGLQKSHFSQVRFWNVRFPLRIAATRNLQLARTCCYP